MVIFSFYTLRISRCRAGDRVVRPTVFNIRDRGRGQQTRGLKSEEYSIINVKDHVPY